MIRQYCCYLLVAIGLLQMIGHLSGLSWLKGLGVLTVASPLPIVFTEVKGIETFASDFYLQFEGPDRLPETIHITPAMYSTFRAPYNYRNVIGAAIAYGPLLPEPLRQSVFQFSFQSPGKLTKSMGLHPPLEKASILLKTRTAHRNQDWRLPIDNAK